MIWEDTHLMGTIAFKLFKYFKNSEKINRLSSTEIRQPLGEGPYRVFESVQSLARAMAHSREMAHRNYVDEALLSLIVGIESLLAEKSNIQNSVARRIGAILALAEDAPFDRMYKEVQDLYNIRSKFVHENFRIDRDVLPRTEQICRCVYFAAFRSQAAMLNADPTNWKNRWLKLLIIFHIRSSLAFLLITKPSLKAGRNLSISARSHISEIYQSNTGPSSTTALIISAVYSK